MSQIEFIKLKTFTNNPDICPSCNIKGKWYNKMCGKDVIRECVSCKYKEHAWIIE